MTMFRSSLFGNSVRSSLVILGILALDVHAAPPPGVSSAAPMDLMPQGGDPNNLQLNPRWQYHVSTKQLPNPPKLPECKNDLQKATCTTQKTSTDKVRPFLWFCKGEPGTIAGHLNYDVVTYDGRLTWHGWEPPFFDSDYGFALTRGDQAGMTSGNTDGIGIEFDSRETIERFHSPWWVAFRNAVKRASADKPSALVNDKFAIVSGLLGLDCVHGCHAEIHPALAMAIRVEEAGNAERWAVFARSGGNEGFCSKDQHSMVTPEQQLVVLLPWRQGMQAADVVDMKFYGTDPQAAPPQAIAEVGKGIALVFDLKGLTKLNTMDGELQVKWTGTAAAAGAGMAGFRTAAFRGGAVQERGVTAAQPATEVSDDESLRGSSEEISRLLLKLSAKVRAAFISELKKELPRYAIAEDYVLKAGPVSRPRGELFSKGRPKLTSAEDPEKAAYDKVLERVLAKFEKDLYAVR